MSYKPIRDYDSTIARIAGNIAPAMLSKLTYELRTDEAAEQLAEVCVRFARAVVAEVRRTEPER